MQVEVDVGEEDDVVSCDVLSLSSREQYPQLIDLC